jgi:hypothetical protein
MADDSISPTTIVENGVRTTADLRDVCLAIAAASRLMADQLDLLELELLDLHAMLDAGRRR